MKRFSTLITLLIIGLLSSLFVSALGGRAHAQPACFTYGQATSITPVFNNICDVGQLLPSTEGNYPIGNERDFVRIRQDTSGEVTKNSTNPKLQNNLTATCNAGDKFDIWNYVHNDASADQNNSGSGTAVAKNVKLALAANGVNTTNSNFNFGSTISASNAETVSDTATLNCNGKQVVLKLVANSIHYNNTTATTPNWVGLSDNYINGTNPIGNPVFGSGTQYGCYDFRTIVVYQVTVENVPTPPPAPQPQPKPQPQPQPLPVTATCDLFSIESTDDRTVKVSNFKFTATNVTYMNTVINWDAGTGKTNDSTAPITDATKVVGQSHQYTADGTYLVTATVHFSTTATGDVVANTVNCQQKVTFKAQTPPVIVTTTTTETPTPPATPVATPVAVAAQPTSLVNTGAGSMATMFTLVSIAGTVAYRYYLSRRLV